MKDCTVMLIESWLSFVNQVPSYHQSSYKKLDIEFKDYLRNFKYKIIFFLDHSIFIDHDFNTALL